MDEYRPFGLNFFDYTGSIKFFNTIHNCECSEMDIIGNNTFCQENGNEDRITDCKK
jgi:hypothetical protein